MTIPISSVTPSGVLPATNIHPHGHHKGGGGSQLATLLDPTASTDTTSTTGTGTDTNATSGTSTATSAASGSTPALFSTILNSLEGVIGASTGISLGSVLNTKA